MKSEWIKPNGKMEHVLETVRSYSSSVHDYIVVIGGTNNVVNGRCSSDFYPDLNKTLDSASGKRIILVGLPTRHDNPSLNATVDLINSNLLALSSKYDNVVFLPVNSIPRSAFTHHGLHLNFKGKTILSNLLLNKLSQSEAPTPRQLSPVGSSHTLRSRTISSKHFLGEARKPEGVPWSHYLKKIIRAVPKITSK